MWSNSNSEKLWQIIEIYANRVSEHGKEKKKKEPLLGKKNFLFFTEAFGSERVLGFHSAMPIVLRFFGLLFETVIEL